MTSVFGAVKDYGKLAGQIPSEDYDYHLAFKGFRRHVTEHSTFLVALMNECTRLLPERRRILLTSELTPSGTVFMSEIHRNAVLEAIDSLLENVDNTLDELRGQRMHAADQLGVVFGASVTSDSLHNQLHTSQLTSSSSITSLKENESYNTDSTLNIADNNIKYYGRALTINFNKPKSEDINNSGNATERASFNKSNVESGQNAQSKDANNITYKFSLGSGNEALRLAHVLRPQLTFVLPLDNGDTPFVPRYADAAGEIHTGEAGVHPFHELITTLPIPPRQLIAGHDQLSIPLSECPLHFIDDAQQLSDMAQELMAHSTEIAIDLEHHDFYSYQGFTCLMQVSSRTADYVIDCLRLRHEMHQLAPLFLNGEILKVLHGAREDVRWLQKDFGLYLVNFFDTGIALQTLHMPHSLAFAVDHFCQVKLDKKYQTADWRVRPLPAEMVHYARSDTHYLLYIYDRLKALLLNSESRVGTVGNVLMHVYHESRRLSLEQYSKPQLDAFNSYKVALGRSLAGLSSRQERVAREVFNWRDSVARDVDDSPMAVMHVSSILAIASQLPQTASEVLRCCHPVSATLRSRIAQLVQIIRSANESNAHNDQEGGNYKEKKKNIDGSDEVNIVLTEKSTTNSAIDKSLQHHLTLEERENAEQHLNRDEKEYNAYCNNFTRKEDEYVTPTKSHYNIRGVHRAMTGTLPSIEFPLHTAVSYSIISSISNNNNNNNSSENGKINNDANTLDGENVIDDKKLKKLNECTLASTEPSSWIKSMQFLSRVLNYNHHHDNQQQQQQQQQQHYEQERQQSTLYNVPLPGSVVIAHLRRQYEAEERRAQEQSKRERQAHESNVMSVDSESDVNKVNHETKKVRNDDSDDDLSGSGKLVTNTSSISECNEVKVGSYDSTEAEEELEKVQMKSANVRSEAATHCENNITQSKFPELLKKEHENKQQLEELEEEEKKLNEQHQEHQLKDKEKPFETSSTSDTPIVIRKAYGKRGKKRQRK